LTTLVVEIARSLLAWYLANMSTFSLVYGAFATVPILLVWIYLGWLIVLMGATLTAHLPSLLGGHAWRSGQVGWPLELALAALRQLDSARRAPPHGMSASELAGALKLDPLQLASLLQTLSEIRWIAAVEPVGSGEPLHVLLVDPEHTPVAPLLQALLLERHAGTEGLWQGSQWQSLSLRSVL
jgi:membrane protein